MLYVIVSLIFSLGIIDSTITPPHLRSHNEPQWSVFFGRTQCYNRVWQTDYQVNSQCMVTTCEFYDHSVYIIKVCNGHEPPICVAYNRHRDDTCVIPNQIRQHH